MARRASTGTEVLSTRALNRALLARQMLLERSDRTPLEAVDHLVGLQAQTPTDPYFALWSRLRDFNPLAMSTLLETRKVARIAVMRATVHWVTAADALQLRTMVQPVLTRTLTATSFGKDTRGVDMDALVAAGRVAVEKKPMTLAELRPILGAAFPGFDPTALSYAFHYSVPLVQVPPRALWGRSGAPKVTTAEHWLKKPTRMPDVARIVLRYLAAFGPASVMDAQAWSGLTKLGAVFDALRPKLVTFRDESGRELFDLPDAPRPRSRGTSRAAGIHRPDRSTSVRRARRSAPPTRTARPRASRAPATSRAVAVAPVRSAAAGGDRTELRSSSQTFNPEAARVPGILGRSR